MSEDIVEELKAVARKKELAKAIKEHPDIYSKEKQKLFDETKNSNFDFQKTQQEILMFFTMKKRGDATETIVQYITEKCKFKTTRNDNNSEIWIYKNGIYKPEGKSYILEFCRELLLDAFTKHICNEVICKIEADTFIEQDEFFNQQSTFPYLIPVQTGLLNIKTKKLEGFTPEKYFFNKLKMPYDPSAKCIDFLMFLDSTLEKESDKQTIQELFGYCLLKDYKYKKSFMFEGKGDNGKSQLLHLLKNEFIGVENSCAVSLEALEKDSFILSEFHNKLVNVSADITQGVLSDTGIYKNLTGKDDIQANRKHKTHITFKNYAKMIFATNSLPHVSDVSDGFWGRWILIEFPHTFLEQSEIDLIPLNERKGIKLADPEIMDNLCDEKELSGILNWALNGFERLEKKKGFSYDNSKSGVKKRWLQKSNSVVAFIDENIEEAYDFHIEKQDFKQKYLIYCSTHKIRPMSDKVIKITLENELSAFSDRLWDEERNPHVWKGIKFTTK